MNVLLDFGVVIFVAMVIGKIARMLYYYTRHKMSSECGVGLAHLTFKQFLVLYNSDPNSEKHWLFRRVGSGDFYRYAYYSNYSAKRPIELDIVFNFIDFMRFQCWHRALEKKRKNQSLTENALSISRQVQADIQKAQKEKEEECRERLEELLNKDSYTPNLTLSNDKDKHRFSIRTSASNFYLIDNETYEQVSIPASWPFVRSAVIVLVKNQELKKNQVALEDYIRRHQEEKSE